MTHVMYHFNQAPRGHSYKGAKIHASNQIRPYQQSQFAKNAWLICSSGGGVPYISIYKLTFGRVQLTYEVWTLDYITLEFKI